MSRLHCRLEQQKGTVVIFDEGSRNGTFVNGSAVADAELCEGDVVRVGNWLGVFTRALEHAEGQPVASNAFADDLIAGSRLNHCLEQAARAARSTIPMVINGESGSGKERVARYVHRLSGRRGDFIAVNCAAIPENLAESELFGYQRGAFTGADVTRQGAFQLAHQGTLLLDEIADLPLSIQAKFLRALEEGAVRPLGAGRMINVDVRLIAAGQTPLRDLVAAGRFRGDLFARLNGMTLTVPPLRERREEILPLFVSALRSCNGGTVPLLETNAAEALLSYDWPYNVREVRQVAHRTAVLHGHQRRLELAHLPEEVWNPVGSFSNDSETCALSPRRDRSFARREQVHQLEEALRRSEGNVSRAASALGISRGRAYRLIRAANERRESRPS